jgi:hypothetical protein
MKPSHRDDRETSVTFSLTELMQMEVERLHDEELARARERESRAREERRIAATRREQEEAAVGARDRERSARLREEAAEVARHAAEQQAVVEVARIEAEGKARLAADEAIRAHELALLRARRDSAAGRWRTAFAGATAGALCAMGALLWNGHRDAQAAEAELARERGARQMADEARTAAARDEAAALERREARVRARAAAVAAEALGAATETARHAAGADPANAARMAAYRDALDTWQGRVEALEREAHRAELEALRRSLPPQRKRGTTGAVPPPEPRERGSCGTDPGDPLCGLDGRPL